MSSDGWFADEADVVREETCENCGEQLTDSVAEPCPECGHYRCPHMGSANHTPCGKAFETKHQLKLHYSQAHDVSFREPKVCPVCEELFIPLRGSQRYCSRDCTYEMQRQREARLCEHCESQFRVVPHSDQQYCSPECAHTSARERDERTCEECGDEFTVPESSSQEYCSATCARRGQSNRMERDCRECGEQFETVPSEDKTFCSVDCAADARSDRVKLLCDFCNRLFQHTDEDRSYCSRSCYLEDHADRPEDFHDRLHEIYVEENHSLRETVRRMPGYSEGAIRKALKERGWYRSQRNLARQMMREDVTSIDDIDFDVGRDDGGSGANRSEGD